MIIELLDEAVHPSAKHVRWLVSRRRRSLAGALGRRALGMPAEVQRPNPLTP
jgi:hypothetical protein